jgi:uncharacterized protein (DUF433 family)
MTEEEILKDFPYLEKEDFQAVYEFFASSAQSDPAANGQLLNWENRAPSPV